MTETVRTRIAAALDQHKTDPYDDWTCQCQSSGTRWADHAADAVIRELPQPVKPTPPQLEDLTVIPPKKHTWGRSWDADIHQGYFCDECDEMSDCELCNTDWSAADDCLVVQADNRNDIAIRSYREAIQDWEAQMKYWRHLTAHEPSPEGVSE